MKRKTIKPKKLKKEDATKLGVLILLIVCAIAFTVIKPHGLHGIFANRAIAQDEWTQDAYAALKDLGGEAKLKDIDKKIRETRLKEKRPVPRNLNALVQNALEEHSSDSKSFKHGDDLFAKPKDKDVWMIRK